MDEDSGFDLCECINSHEGAMQRLLGILRRSQELCSDSSCVDDFSPVPQASANPFNVNMMMFFAMLALFSAFFFGLPRRLSSDGKPSGGFNRSNRDPPAIS